MFKKQQQQQQDGRITFHCIFLVWSGYLPPKHATVFLLGKILIRFNNAKKFFYLILLTLPVVFFFF